MESINSSRGFSLIELLVVAAIIGVVMSIVLNSQSTFNKTLILKNAAYDIALTLRSAETYGMGSRATDLYSGDPISNAGYGIHFEKATPSSFILFADTSGGVSCAGMPPSCIPGDYIYTSGELVQNYTLGNGMKITDFCAKNSFGSWSCARDSLSSLDIVFSRPNPTPSIRADNNPSMIYSEACITVSSPQGGKKFVSVISSGQITANAEPDTSSCYDYE